MGQCRSQPTGKQGCSLRNRRLEANPLYWYYGAGSIAFGIKGHAFSYLLLLFATHILDLPGYKAALAMAIAMLWDAVTDLFLGHWSDKTRSRLGRRHPFMYASLFILPLSFYLLFNPIDGLGETSRFLHLLLFAILIRTGTTLFEVPSVAQLPELEEDYDHRNRWLALRQAFGWYGGNLIHTVNFLVWVGAYGVAQQTGYTFYSIAGAVSITSPSSFPEAAHRNTSLRCHNPPSRSGSELSIVKSWRCLSP